MRLIKLAVAMVALVVLSAVRADDAAAQQFARVRVSVTVVSETVSPAATDSLVAAAQPSNPGRLVSKGVRVIVKDPVPGRVAERTRKVEIHYVGV